MPAITTPCLLRLEGLERVCVCVCGVCMCVGSSFRCVSPASFSSYRNLEHLQPFALPPQACCPSRPPALQPILYGVKKPELLQWRTVGT